MLKNIIKTITITALAGISLLTFAKPTEFQNKHFSYTLSSHQTNNHKKINLDNEDEPIILYPEETINIHFLPGAKELQSVKNQNLANADVEETFSEKMERIKNENSPSFFKQSEDTTGSNLLPQNPWLETFLFATYIAVITIVICMIIYTIRHYSFTWNRLFSVQRYPYIDIIDTEWPNITIFIAAHNEEQVIANSIESLLNIDYPHDKLTITPVNDRSTDKTKEIIDKYAALHPNIIKPFHRADGKPGKAAALKDATDLCTDDIVLVFDADYVPSKGLIKQLVSPFFDPEVGSVMGRVVPMNTKSNLLTRLLELERSGGYQVDQQARMNLDLVPQYGGTVGGFRKTALNESGGWHDDVLAEDTDITFRLMLNGYKVIYQNRSECYEEVPEEWSVRIKQIKRWAKGHNQALFRHFRRSMSNPYMSLSAKIDGVFLLFIYLMSPLLFLSWFLAVTLFFFNYSPLASTFLVLFGFISYSALGNFAAFFEIAAATHLDGGKEKLKLLPVVYLNFLISVIAISSATVELIWQRLRNNQDLKWDKTVRYRKDETK
jgi:cellulose synthase/poly-beta-1,6-N-acetylglucosamine synthase-like glycosyltransferase